MRRKRNNYEVVTTSTTNTKNQTPRKAAPKGLIIIINILGFINIIGMLYIIIIGDNATTNNKSSSYGIEQLYRRKPSHHYYGVNKTISQLEALRIKANDLKLPPWKWIEDQYGDGPILFGLDRCHEFRNQKRRKDCTFLAPVGLFNSGTNLLVELINLNCKRNNYNDTSKQQQQKQMPMSLFQPPWGKHTPRDWHESHVIPKDLYRSIQKTSVLPVVIIRHPIDWLRSMCRRPYAAYWPFEGRLDPNFVCPSILDGNNRTQTILVLYGAGNRTYETIVHLWNEWYRGWYNTLSFPRVIVRMEDLLYYPQLVITELCHCIGGRGGTSLFRMVMNSSKMNQTGHFNHSTTFLNEFLEHAHPFTKKRIWNKFTSQDRIATRTILDKELLNVFHYQLP